jgi:nicotinamidase/pyrazinamidase
MSKRALLVIDMQNDFMPGGALAAPEGDQIVERVNQLMQDFELVVASKDYHPEETIHFEKWPKHCVQGTKGAQFHPDLQVSKINQVFYKGTGNADDGYSAFEATNKDLKKYLKDRKIKELYLVGLTTEFCVKESAIDAARARFNTFVISDAIAAVRAEEDGPEKAMRAMGDAGVRMISTDSVLAV